MENGGISSKDETILVRERLIGIGHTSSSFLCVTFLRRWHQVLEGLDCCHLGTVLVF